MIELIVEKNQRELTLNINLLIGGKTLSYEQTQSFTKEKFRKSRNNMKPIFDPLIKKTRNY